MAISFDCVVRQAATFSARPMREILLRISIHGQYADFVDFHVRSVGVGLEGSDVDEDVITATGKLAVLRVPGADCLSASEHVRDRRKQESYLAALAPLSLDL